MNTNGDSSTSTYSQSPGANTSTSAGSATSSSNTVVGVNQNQMTQNGFQAYSKRTTRPTKDDKCYLKYGKKNVNGYDRAIEITEPCKYTYGSCLPNCVGYMWGRVYEISKQYNTKLPTTYALGVGNARTAWGHNPKAWARGQQPRLGAVICYDSIKHGHVAIVEKLKFDKNGNIESMIFSEGCWINATRGVVFQMNSRKAKNNYRYGTGNPLQGFIYPPYCNLFSPDGKGAADNTLSKETIVVLSGAVAKYMQTYVSHYDSANPGFNVDEPPAPPKAQDKDGETLVVGNSIEVTGAGNTSKTGSGKELNQLGERYTLKSFHPGFPFPYRLGPKDGRGVGYWPESAIKKL